MSIIKPKPVFTFKGLSYLYHIEQCRLRPVGYDRQGVKYFELVDVIANKQFFTAEIASIEEDLVVKDKYGVIRFCINGWNAMAQMDVYINIRRPVGAVKDGVFYDHNLVPIFTARRENMQKCSLFGPFTYKIRTVLTEDEVGFVTPEPSSVHLEFSQLLDEGPKALLLSYALQLALAKYKFLNLNLSKVRYVYKDRAKAKAKKQQRIVEEQQQLLGSKAPTVPMVPVMVTPYSIGAPSTMYSPPTSVCEPRKSSKAEKKPPVFVINVPEQKQAPPPPAQVVMISPPPSQKSNTERRRSSQPPPPPTIPIPPQDSVTGESPDMLLVKVTQRKQRVSDASKHRKSLELEDLEGPQASHAMVSKSQRGSTASRPSSAKDVKGSTRGSLLPKETLQIVTGSIVNPSGGDVKKKPSKLPGKAKKSFIPKKKSNLTGSSTQKAGKAGKKLQESNPSGSTLQTDMKTTVSHLAPERTELDTEVSKTSKISANVSPKRNVGGVSSMKTPKTKAAHP